MRDARADPHEVTRLLDALAAGDAGAAERLARVVYGELREIARVAMARERATHTWQPTELVHEAYMRLLGPRGPTAWNGRAHFYGVASRLMRQLLVEHARGRGRVKRDGGLRVTLDDELPLPGAADGSLDLLALDDALERLAAVDARQAHLVELRFFGGLTIEEAAESLGVSVATAKRDWTFARAFLRLELDAAVPNG